MTVSAWLGCVALGYPGRERYSIAFFLDPNPDAEVACLPGCMGAGEAPKYQPVTGADFLKMRLAATYEHVRAGG